MRLVLLTFLFLLTGCVTRIADFTILSTRNIELSRVSDYQRSGIRAEGDDARPIIIIIPAGVPNVEEAIEEAVDSVPGGIALVDGAVYYSYFYIPYLFGEYKYSVEGEVLIDPQRTTPEAVAKARAAYAEEKRKAKERKKRGRSDDDDF